MVDSLKPYMQLPPKQFMQVAEQFAQDALGVSVVMADMSDVHGFGQMLELRERNATGDMVNTGVQVPSIRTAAYAEQARQDLADNIQAKLMAQQPQLDPALHEGVAKFSKLYANLSSNIKIAVGNDQLADTTSFGGGYMFRNFPPELAAAGLDMHVVLLDSSNAAHLRPLPEQLATYNCGPRSAEDRYIAEMARLHFTYHEIGHAKREREYEHPNLMSRIFGTGRGRDDINFGESISDGFASLMMLRDFGTEALPFLKLVAYDGNAFAPGTDVAHYTAPTMLKVLELAQTEMADIRGATPQQLYARAVDLAERNALKIGEPQLLTEHRARLTAGEALVQSDIPALATYDDITKVRMTELDQALKDVTHLGANQPAADGSCHKAVDLRVLEQLNAHGYKSGDEAKSRAMKPSLDGPSN